MKAMPILLVCQLWLNSYGQYVPFDLLEINDLYITEQYAPFADKMNNLGFRLDKSVHDYELNGIKHKAEFSFTLKTQAPPTNLLANTFDDGKQESFWMFKTEEHRLFKNVDIRFKFYLRDSEWLFTKLYDKLVKEVGQPTEEPNGCVGSDKCMRFIDRSENFARDVEGGGLRELPNKFYCFVDYYKNEYNGKDQGAYINGSLSYCISKYPLGQPVQEYVKELKENKSKSIVSVPVVSEGKISRVNVLVGGKSISYIIDSGASDMNINESMERYLKEIGTVRSTDYLTAGKYQLADGSIKEYRRVMISTVKIGDLTIESVPANIIRDNEPLLLGKSFLNRFSFWKIDNEKKSLELKR